MTEAIVQQGVSEAPAAFEGFLVPDAARLLGGERVVGRTPRDPMETHDLLVEGLPGRALSHIMEGLTVLEPTESLEKAIGISLRTFQRRKDEPSKPLSADQSGRTWKFAEILAWATRVLGSQEEAERWLDRPAIGLNRRRPLDLLATPPGVIMVEQYLGRMEYGVYT
jgi:putative toxin-antitoxin system antitoxin component (TIGR02293 family)